MPPSPKNLAPGKIRAALKRNRMTQVGLARELSVSGSMVQKVIDGLAVSHRVRGAVSRACGIPLSRLWPSSYAAPGGPRGPGRPRIVENPAEKGGAP